MNEIPDDTASHQYADEVYRVMRRQAALGLRVAAVFVVLIVGLPIYNYYWPYAASIPVFGFTRTWLFLGVAFFPITWLLSAYFVRESDRIEAEAAKAVLALPPRTAAEPATSHNAPDDAREDAQ